MVPARMPAQWQKGTGRGRKPWSPTTVAPRNLITNKPYRGVNVFLLGGHRFASPYFLTFKQALQRGGAVKKGERGCPIVFWKWNDDEEKESVEPGGQEKTSAAPALRSYPV